MVAAPFGPFSRRLGEALRAEGVRCSRIILNAGDVMVQRGTNHGWFNRGTETARVAFVLVDAQPLGIGHPRT